MMDYYDRQGNRTSVANWDMEYRRVARTQFKDGAWLSTVHLPIDRQYGDGPPLIFESMLFLDQESFSEIAANRYSTEKEALEGHRRMVAAEVGAGRQVVDE